MPKKIPKGEGMGTLEGQRMAVGVEAWEGLGREGTPQTFTWKCSQHLRRARRLRRSCTSEAPVHSTGGEG